MEQEVIKGCHHCGGAACLNSNYSYRTRSYFVFVRCDVCGAQGKIYKSTDEPEAAGWNNQPCRDAVAAWNMRTSEREAEA